MIWKGKVGMKARIPVLFVIALLTAWLLSVAVSPTLARKPPIKPNTHSEINYPASRSGWFNILWGDGKPGASQAETIQYQLIDDGGQVTPLVMGQILPRPLDELLKLNGLRVRIGGEWVIQTESGSRSTALQVISLTPEEGQSPQGLSGSQPWLSILCKFADVPDEPKTPEFFQSMYSASYPGLDHYWREVSYDAINLQGSNAVGQWYTLPQPRSYYVYDMDADGLVELDTTRAAQDCTAAADPFVYMPDYVGFNLMFNYELDGPSWGGGQNLTLDGVTKGWRMTWLPPWGYTHLTVTAHEMGHGFGMPHSSGNYGLTYDNQWDMMSDSWSNCANATDPVLGCLPQDTIVIHLKWREWIPASQQIFVTPGAQATFTLEQLDIPQTVCHALLHGRDPPQSRLRHQAPWPGCDHPRGGHPTLHSSACH
jgi:hypothetical protein